jgi:hypothetical protein
MNYQNEKEFAQLMSCFRKLTPRSHVLEIGSLHGETLSFLIQDTERGGVVMSIDQLVPPADARYEKQKLGHEFTWHQWAKQNEVTFCCFDRNSREQILVDLMRAVMPEIDFLFIDGGHDYATCKADWDNYGTMVREGGMVAFHDLGREWPDVRRVWEQARVGKVSQEFVESPDQYGIGVLWK